MAGKDASKQFWKYHNDSILKKYQKQLQVGSLDSKAAPPAAPATAAKEIKKETKDVVKPEANSGVVAPQPTAAAADESEPFDSFGDIIPYADPSWYQTVRPVLRKLMHNSSDTNTTVPFPLLQRNARCPPRGSPRMGRGEAHAQCH